jgi:hypothetical protein
MIFWDEKRPITAEILKRLNISEVAAFLGQAATYDDFNNHGQGTLGNQSEVIGAR